MENNIDDYIGKSILIGACYFDHEGKLLEQKQVHGIIIEIKTDESIIVELKNNDKFYLPPQLDSLQKAPSGEFREHSTGDIIVDPDYIIMLEFYMKGKSSEEWHCKLGPKIQFPDSD
jgi:hypothetical protein